MVGESFFYASKGISELCLGCCVCDAMQKISRLIATSALFEVSLHGVISLTSLSTKFFTRSLDVLWITF